MKFIKTAIIIFVIFILVLVLVNIGIKVILYNNANTTNQTLAGIERVKDRILFFTAEECVQKYAELLQEKDYTKIISLLAPEYVDGMQIDVDNIKDKLDDNLSIYGFKALEVYCKGNTYYVFGNMLINSEEPYEDDSGLNYSISEQSYNIAVILDELNQTYMIIPKGFMGQNSVKHNLKNKDAEITVNKYINYMAECEVYITVKNKSNAVLDLSNVKIEYYEDTNPIAITEGSNTEELKLQANASKEVKLVFDNKVKTPKRLIFNLNGTNETVNIIKNLNTMK